MQSFLSNALFLRLTQLRDRMKNEIMAYGPTIAAEMVKHSQKTNDALRALLAGRPELLLKAIIFSIVDRVLAFVARCTQIAPGATRLTLLSLELIVGAQLVNWLVHIVYASFRALVGNTWYLISIGQGFSSNKAKDRAHTITVPIATYQSPILRITRSATGIVKTIGTFTAFVGGVELLQAAVQSRNRLAFSDVVYWFVRSLMTLRPIRQALRAWDLVLIWGPLTYLVSSFFRARGTKAQVMVVNTINIHSGERRTVRNITVDPAILIAAVDSYAGITDRLTYLRDWLDAVGEMGPRWALRQLRAPHLPSSAGIWRLLWGMATLPLRWSITALTAYRPGPSRRFVPVDDGLDRHVASPVLPPFERAGLGFVRQSQLDDDLPASPSPAAPVVSIARREHPSMRLAEDKPPAAIPPPSQLYNPRDPPWLEKTRLTATLPLATFPIELFTKDAIHIGKDLGGGLVHERDLMDPRFDIRLPFRPLVNNRLFMDFLTFFPELRARLDTLMRIPPTPARMHIEALKYGGVECKVDFRTERYRGWTERDFILSFMRLQTNFTQGKRLSIRPMRYDSPDECFSSESLKHHPGLFTRLAMKGAGVRCADKRDAWEYSYDLAKKEFKTALAGGFNAFQEMGWLALPVVKKQGSRKSDFAVRCRLAAIPEEWYQIVIKHVLQPYVDHCEASGNARSVCSKFDIFHNGLSAVYDKFRSVRDCSYLSEDTSDHGASLTEPVMEILAEFFDSVMGFHPDLNATTSVHDFIMGTLGAMVKGRLLIPDVTDDEVQRVSVVRTNNGMFDGVMFTNYIGTLMDLVKEGHRLWKIMLHEKLTPESFFEVRTCYVAEIHGDNATMMTTGTIAKYYRDMGFLVSSAAEIGQIVKPEETVISSDIRYVSIMSVYISPLVGHPRKIVAWRPVEESLKGLMFPERFIDYDHLKEQDVNYIASIVTSLYILGYWNPHTRGLLERFWLFLAARFSDRTIPRGLIRDFEFKFGFKDTELIDIRLHDPVPYPHEKVRLLWTNSVTPGEAEWAPSPGAAAAELVGFDRTTYSAWTTAHADEISSMPLVYGAEGDLQTLFEII